MTGFKEKLGCNRARVLALVFFIMQFAACRTREPLATKVEASPPDPLALAIAKVEEDRGEATGDLAAVEVPQELKHYSDRRMFLAVQVAEARRLSYEGPRDFAELVRLISAGDLVEMEPFSEDHLLYGVGEKATDDLFTHYDAATNSDIPLFSTYQQFQNELDRLNVSLGDARAGIAGLEAEMRSAAKIGRARRKVLRRLIAEGRKSASGIEERKKLLATFYQDRDRSKEMDSEYRLLADFAKNFNGKSYDLSIPDERRQFRVRLLSFIRPEARDVLLEIARSYRAGFNRPLPVTSLVRTGDYQRHLRETNKNAATNATPPHTTGLAFDIYDYYMSAAEQNFLMAEIAGLEAEGRVEALRERRDHIHVFAFAEGTRPDGESIARALGGKRAGAKHTRLGSKRH